MESVQFAFRRFAAFLVFSLIAFAALQPGQAEEGDLLYSVSRGGDLIGYLRIYWDGGKVLQGIFRDTKGLVLFQDRYDHGEYEAASDDHGSVSRLIFKADRGVTVFDRKTIHHLFLLKSSFPRKIGGTRKFKMVDPVSKAAFDAEAEFAGFEVVPFGDASVKLRHYLFDVRGDLIQVYLDQGSDIVLMEVPASRTSFRLTGAAPAGYPMESWELRQGSPCCIRREIRIQSPNGRVLNGKLIAPAKGSHFPGAVIFGPGNPQSTFLESLGYQLSGQGVASFICPPDEKASMEERLEDADTLFRFLRRQRGVDPGHMFVVGFEAGVQDAAALMRKRKDLSASLFLSPETELRDDFLGGSTPLLILQGEKDSLRQLERMQDWSSRVNREGKGASITWSLVPEVGHDFLANGPVSLKFSVADTERTVDNSVFGYINSWLSELGLVQAPPANVPGAQR